VKLRIQLLIAGALTLVLPAIAYRAVHQIDTVLRQDRNTQQLERIRAAQALVSVSGAMDNINVAASGENLNGAGFKPANMLYAERLRHSIFLDGYDDDWVRVRQPPVNYPFSIEKLHSEGERSTTLPGVSVRAAVSATHLYLFFKVSDDRIVFYNPSSGLVSTGDHVELMWLPSSNEGEMVRRYFSAVAAGGVQARYYGKRFEGLQAVLTDNSASAVLSEINQGYQLEVRLPRPEVNSRFGFAVVNRNVPAKSLVPGDEFGYRPPDILFSGTLDPSFADTQSAQAFLVYPSFMLASVISDIVPPGTRLRVFDGAGRLRADVNRLYENKESPGLSNPRHSNFFNAVLYRFYEWVVQRRERAEFDPFTPSQPFILDLDALQSTGSLQESEISSHGSRPKTYLTADNDYVTGTLHTVGADEGSAGWILAEINENHTNAFTRSAMVRIFSLLIAVSFLVAVCLLLFSISLALRLRRWSR